MVRLLSCAGVKEEMASYKTKSGRPDSEPANVSLEG